MKILKNTVYKFDIENYEKFKMNPIQYKLLYTYYSILEGIGRVLCELPNPLGSYLYFKLQVKYYRKRRFLQLLYINSKSESFYCNVCGKLVFKGIAKSLLMNCPYCHSVYTIFPDKTSKIKLCQSTKSVTSDVSKEDLIDTGLKGTATIMGIEYKIIDY